ncbi:uncharacterized protein K441DRAFT_302571 [Cenococcum geophilum 1.58]|uniref:uncharacterized protein n=1 Tax=Cenococcum geophilum 1.58 TaxID=794803 RepID=UPI00358EEFBB|nr:hypothetical protein K441DRAFT_302571 [Cenococcum geophilum 1.58]
MPTRKRHSRMSKQHPKHPAGRQKLSLFRGRPLSNRPASKPASGVQYVGSDNVGSDDSGDTDDNDARDGDSSDSDEGNEACGCTGRRSPTSICGQLKPKRAAKHYPQRSHHTPSISSMYTSDWSTALTSNYRKRVTSSIYNRLRTQKPLLISASTSNSNKAIPGAALNVDSEEFLI